jgi:hypothetical protein
VARRTKLDAHEQPRLREEERRTSVAAEPAARVLEWQRSIGNAGVARLLADRRAQHGPTLHRKVGRTDGSHDMDASQVQTWLENVGLWKTLSPAAIDMVEAMLQSDDDWLYSGMAAIDLVRDAREFIRVGLAPAAVRDVKATVPYDRNLIHGTLVRSSNKADFHVSPGDASTLTADMLFVADDVYKLMTLTSRLPGRGNGVVYLRPQGAAIIKIVSQLLGEALGNPAQVKLARDAYKWRKIEEAAINLIPKFLYTKKKMSNDVLDKSVASEHTEYIKALVGAAGVDIKPLLPGTKTIEEFTQNMLEASNEGRERLRTYLETVQAANTPVSMDIYVERDTLPKIIDFMRNPPNVG